MVIGEIKLLMAIGEVILLMIIRKYFIGGY